MSTTLATDISGMVNSFGPEFPDMTPNGGTLLGYKVIVSNEIESDIIRLIGPPIPRTLTFIFPPV